MPRAATARSKMPAERSLAARARRKEITTGADYLVAVEIGGERVVGNADHDPDTPAECADAGEMSWLSGKPGMASMPWRLMTLGARADPLGGRRQRRRGWCPCRCGGRGLRIGSGGSLRRRR